MKRRDVLGLPGGAAAWPLAARAQPAMPVVGFLSSLWPGPFASFVAAFRQGLKDGGFVEGQNVAIDLKTAKTLGLTFPITLLGRADEVIE